MSHCDPESHAFYRASKFCRIDSRSVASARDGCLLAGRRLVRRSLFSTALFAMAVQILCAGCAQEPLKDQLSAKDELSAKVQQPVNDAIGSEPVATEKRTEKPTANAPPSDAKGTADQHVASESPRMLPKPPASPGPAAASGNDVVGAEIAGADTAMERTKQDVSISDPLTNQEKQAPVDERVTPDKIAAKAFAPPADAKAISKQNLWVDRKLERVYIDGYVAMNDGPLEMFACPAGTKEHESVVATLPKAAEVHAALLAIGAQVGTPVSYDPTFVPATGQRIRVWVCYYDSDGAFKAVDARQWIVKVGTKDVLEDDWVFSGSTVWKDPADGRNYYQADGGDMICVSNFSTAMMDIPVASSADTDSLGFSPYTERIPERGTPVRLVLQPIPLPTDAPEPSQAAPAPPTAKYLQLAK